VVVIGTQAEHCEGFYYVTQVHVGGNCILHLASSHIFSEQICMVLVPRHNLVLIYTMKQA